MLAVLAVLAVPEEVRLRTRRKRQRSTSLVYYIELADAAKRDDRRKKNNHQPGTGEEKKHTNFPLIHGLSSLTTGREEPVQGPGGLIAQLFYGCHLDCAATGGLNTGTESLRASGERESWLCLTHL